ncbi:MAG: hypothetical protein JSU07_01555 [Bacteroidetes bacterium]|nr:hypothetical protein [Bacteroidota bacterium]
MCDNKPGEAMFEIEELFKGNVTKSYKILFECNTECAQQLSIGDEWIIYANYKQINNAALNWCSRSRKYFKIENQDFYKIITGVDYTDELNYLRKELGLHRFIKANNIDDGKRNILPNLLQSSLLLIASLIGMVVFYWVFKKFVK